MVSWLRSLFFSNKEEVKKIGNVLSLFDGMSCGQIALNKLGIEYEGFYSSEIDKHQGKYEALCQRNGTVAIFRDNNKDMTFDDITRDNGMFGINIHKAGQDSTWVENWSEGCQVFKRVKDFEIFMKICRLAAKIHGNKFSYTLIESKDIA